MYMKVMKVVVFMGLCSVCMTSSVSKERRFRRDDITLKDLFSGLIDSLLGDQKNATINSTALPSTLDWLKTLTHTSTHTVSSSKSATSSSSPSSTSGKPSSENSTSADDQGVENGTSVATSGTNATHIPLFSLTSTANVIEERCGAEYTFTQLCGKTLPQLLVDLTIWDVYAVIFSNDVIEALLLNCNSGHWCLYDEFDYWNGLMMEKATMVRGSEMFSQICQATSLSCLDTFLQNVTGCPIQEVNIIY